MADIKVSDLVKIIPDAFIPENAMNKEAIIQLIATGNDGGEWVIRIKDQICQVEKGKTEKPDFSLKADSTDILKIFFGELDPLRAYMRGKISFKGRIKQAMELTNLFQNDRNFYESRL